MQKILAIACADLHLCQIPPLARSKEPDWFKAMARPLKEISDLAEKHSVPVLCAGDLFHRCAPNPELINFAIDALPEMYAIPGQHDLPYHSHTEIEKSGYWTLVKAGIITHVEGGEMLIPDTHEPFWLNGYGWKQVIKPSRFGSPNCVHICLHHAYRWIQGAGHAHASLADFIYGSTLKEYEGYDIVIIGDNHISWEIKNKDQTIFNVGSLMRRHSDQAEHKPRVGLIMSDGTVQSHYLDISQDVFNPVPHDVSESAIDTGLEEFVNQLRNLQTSSLDFAEVLKRVMEARPMSEEAKTFLLEALDVRKE